MLVPGHARAKVCPPVANHALPDATASVRAVSRRLRDLVIRVRRVSALANADIAPASHDAEWR